MSLNKKKVSTKKLKQRLLKIQREMHELIGLGSGKSNAFWLLHEKMVKIQLRIYTRAKKKSFVTIPRKR